MRSFERRIWLTAAIMLVCYFTTEWVRAGYQFEVVPLPRDLAAIPMDLDGFHGEDQPLNERVAQILNAQQSLNRVYRHPNGSLVLLGVSAWLRPETVSEVAPHAPKLCYTNTGWTIAEERTVHVKAPAGDIPLVVMLCEKNGERIVVGYWYQIGINYFNTATEARRIHRDLWGKRQWPPTVKVLIQTSAASIDAAMPEIERFAVILERELSAMPEATQ